MSRAPIPARFSPFAWHHVRGAVPADWEVSRYSVEDRAGRLEFATRDGLRATVGWEPCAREPDRPTTMATFLANHLIGRKEARRRGLRATDVRTEEAGAYLLGWLDETLPVQALAWDRAGGSLVSWVFEGGGGAENRRAAAEILRTCDFNDEPGAAEYRLFGIDAVLPRDWKIEDMVSLPANVKVCFEGETSMGRAVFRRWGLASTLLEGQAGLLPFWRMVAATDRIELLSSERCRINGREGFSARFAAPREHHGDRFMARRWKNGRAWVWHDPGENRIHSFEQIGPETAPVLDPLAADRRIRSIEGGGR